MRFSFVKKSSWVPAYEVYDDSGKYLGQVTKTRDTSGMATRWKAEGPKVNSKGHVTREHAAQQLARD